MIARDIQQRLTVTLGPQIPVLMPEEIRTPLEAAPLDAQGRPVIGQGQRGIGAYLAQHPSGYVQIEQPVPITSDGLTGTFWVAVASIHTSEQDAYLLWARAYRVLNGFAWAPGPYREVTPGQPEPLAPGAWMVRATYEILTIDGDTAG